MIFHNIYNIIKYYKIIISIYILYSNIINIMKYHRNIEFVIYFYLL